MQIAIRSPRVGAIAEPTVRSVSRYAQTGRRFSYRSGLIACAVAIGALLSTNRTAEAQLKIIDLNFYEDAESEIKEVDGILKTEKCLFAFRADDLTKRLKDTIETLLANYGPLLDARDAKQISVKEYTRVYERGLWSKVRLERLIDRIKDFPRCLNFVGRPPARTPQVGSLILEPKMSFGLVGWSGTSSYDSTGGQAPFNGDWSHSTGQICGGATFYPGFAIGPARVGLDLNACSGSNTFGSGDTTLFAIMRHGPGDVVLRSSTSVIIDTLVKAEIPLGGNPEVEYDSLSHRFFVSVGVGPTFREQNLNLTSDQSFFGGGVPSIRETTWQTGFAVSAGLSTFVCPTCIAGNPLKVGIEGRARFFASQSNSLHSIAFAFEERGSTGSTTDYSALITFSTPLKFHDPIADRFGH